MQNSIGKGIKTLRLSRSMTLKDLSEQTDLSIGFLSQVERGLTALAITSLERIAQALEVDLSYFFPLRQQRDSQILRSYENEVFQVENGQYIHYHLTNSLDTADMLPKRVDILPMPLDMMPPETQHEGEEFVYVLEGIFTMILEGQKIEMHPGDSAHFPSHLKHNWANYTSKVTKILVVHTPNGFKGEADGEEDNR